MSIFAFMVFIVIISKLLHSSSETPKYDAILPRSITALSGSCVEIPCTFKVSDFEDRLKTADITFGCWIKTDQVDLTKPDNIVFNGSQNIIRGFSHIEMLGNVSQRECTTVFYDIMKNHSDIYYFRLQMEPNNVFRATFVNSPINISVSDVPMPPKLTLNDLQEVMENRIVNVSCSAEAPCPKQPPKLSWSNIPKSAIITTQLQEKPDKTQSVFSQITFKPSYMDDRKNISCTVTYPRNTSNDTTVETTMMLRVLFPPKETHVIIKPSASVSVGTNVTLTCKSKASPSKDITYTWYKHGQDSPLACEKKISFIATHTGHYFCVAQNKCGNHSSTAVKLEIKDMFGIGLQEMAHFWIAGCVGGILVLLLVSLVIFIMRGKTSRVVNVIQHRASNQFWSENLDLVPVHSDTDIVINQDSKFSDDEMDKIHYVEIDFSNIQTSYNTRKYLNRSIGPMYAEIQFSKKLQVCR
ncbi:B-cell receptor CD22-like [Myxocyprinus asiaticus]|uniref:B-cell receptor CD22-like n=1 Tax=Myxocyprinus asiaticus TaxID=70543 RepID=UPI002223BF1C|nr:B-cell receptor CD22-like [Myxocyprinus asiaticus]